MVTKAKLGKSRKDKFYKLSKEIGYRSRAAFKLLQLDRKYHFFSESRICVDLCAAPGSWMQVASNNMPVSSLIIGCDLVHINPIPRCITFTSDITTDKCKQRLKSELQNWKVDIFLHDGAPNVGQSWIHDAFQQAKLTLSALKLACSFLKHGGWFVTKIFRSKDYNALLHVFRQLFGDVSVTKPSASRNESCEIYVICKDFTCQKNLNMKLFEASHVFEDKAVDVTGNDMYKSKLYSLLNKKKKTDGYPNDSVFNVITDENFVNSTEPILTLANYHKIDVITEKIINSPLTTPEIVEYCNDICLIGKPEIKKLLKWRRELITCLYTVEQPEKQLDSDEELEQQEIKYDRKLAYLTQEEKREEKRKMRREKKLKKRNDLKTQLKSRDRLGIDGEELTDKIFSLKSLKNSDIKQESEAELYNEDLIVELANKNENRQKVVSQWFDNDILKQAVEIKHEPNITDKCTLKSPKLEEMVKKSKNKKRKLEKSSKIVLTPEELVLGENMLKSKKNKLEFIEDSFNRYTNNDDVDNLPDWFVEDEKKHCKRKMHVDEKRKDFYLNRERPVDSKTLKKSVEARMRKKKREFNALEKARKQAEHIADNMELGEGEKWQSIKRVYKKAGLLDSKKKNVTYVVCKRGAGGKVRRPKGVKGQFKVVDARMKKDNRVRKNKIKKKKGVHK